MNKFIIKIETFSSIPRLDEIVVVETEKSLEETLNLMKKQLEEQATLFQVFEYNLYGWDTVESYIDSLIKYDVDK